MSSDGRREFGDGSRWLINKHANGRTWLLHEPIEPNSNPALELDTFDQCRRCFIAFTKARADAQA